MPPTTRPSRPQVAPTNRKHSVQRRSPGSAGTSVEAGGVDIGVREGLGVGCRMARGEVMLARLPRGCRGCALGLTAAGNTRVIAHAGVLFARAGFATSDQWTGGWIWNGLGSGKRVGSASESVGLEAAVAVEMSCAFISASLSFRSDCLASHRSPRSFKFGPKTAALSSAGFAYQFCGAEVTCRSS